MEITLSLTFFATILISTLPLPTVAQFDNCTDEIGSLSPCFGYIGQRDEFPPPECCYRLEDVVESKPDCLCEVLRGDEGVNRTRFSELPSVCGVRTPSFGNCYYEGKKKKEKKNKAFL
ncbi:Bifunctional inhibitor/lipid-transfer protein/seed storage 2S albumin superfamily protein [Striga hermonthica]|uniref:Bifunctional inhibitor/lipid-transfer protein/seed storage 2S albumin superfamily protein n=1 Tax=Striga hermonthica TaxID=68872 RepID=A0A9N7MV15_STRHE|nr:Bifunctional inhibitor/lipid-transfer protein/seed storage 2S albumin superfamily protein [Striga hermonthica]